MLSCFHPTQRRQGQTLTYLSFGRWELVQYHHFRIVGTGVLVPLFFIDNRYRTHTVYFYDCSMAAKRTDLTSYVQ